MRGSRRVKRVVRSTINPLQLPIFFFAGKAVLTFQNPKTGNHMTVKVKQLRDKADRKKKLPIFYVYVSLLNDNVTGYRFAATVFQETLTFKLGKDVSSDSQLGKVMLFLLHSLKTPQFLNENRISLHHEGHCLRCGLPLTHPESIDTGFGPDCLEIVLQSYQDLDPYSFFQKI